MIYDIGIGPNLLRLVDRDSLIGRFFLQQNIETCGGWGIPLKDEKSP